MYFVFNRTPRKHSLEIPRNDLGLCICTYMVLCDGKNNYGLRKGLFLKIVNTLCNKEKFSDMILFFLKNESILDYLI